MLLTICKHCGEYNVMYGAISGARISDEESGSDNEDGQEVKMEMTEKKQKAHRKKLEEQYAKRDARARTIIRNTIDMRAFEHSTIDCKTAQELWEKLQPTQAATEQEISRLIASSRIEHGRSFTAI